MKKPAVHVTDHAVIRYLERVMGYDIEGLRQQLGREVAPAVELGACGLVSNGFRFVIIDGTLVTVTRTAARAQATFDHRERE